MNEAAFQELCDAFLIREYQNYIFFSRTGSQAGKQKTVKGTPDSLILQSNRKCVLVEYSTNVTKGIAKLIDDVRKCINSQTTHIPIEDIEKIVLCTNFKIKPSDIQKIVCELPENKIRLQVYDLDSLSLELFFHHRNLIHEYLGLPMDTGQIVSVNQFIHEYNRASRGIATPLDNKFLYREKELQDLNRKLQHSDLVILYGAPGTGKTRLALETINRLVEDNPSYTSYCISYKNIDLIGDLSFYLLSDKDYILLVDDANRIDNFLQILNFYKGQRSGNLKILITVRDYSFESLKKMCVDFEPDFYAIYKFTDEQIVDMIKEEPLGILNSRYQKEIVRIARGNIRLAIMTALLAKEKQNLNALTNVSDLFEKYFQTFLRDLEDFSEKINVQVLGLIAFFRALQYRNKEKMSEILLNFQIDYNCFIETIEKLDRFEIVEIQYDFVKVSEQNLMVFFFYKAFIKDSLLSFETLLDRYFDSHTECFTDCVIPANNSFGYDNVMQKVKPALKEYWNGIIGNKEKEIKFISVFWFYLQDETLDFVYDLIERLPECNDVSYEMMYEENKIAFVHNDVIEILGRFFHYSNNLKDALELALEYCRKKPQYVSLLLHNIRQELSFYFEDELNGFSRQNILFELLVKGMNQGDKLYLKIFFELAKTFLVFRFHHYTSGIKKYSITLGSYFLPNNGDILKFRARIWNNMNEYFSEDAFEVLKSYTKAGPDVIKEIMEYDLSFISQIIEKHLNPEIFRHCCYVHNQIWQYRHFKIDSPHMKKLSQKFTNTLYEFFLKFRWDMMRDKEFFEYKNYDEYKILKENQIRKCFLLTQDSDVKEFCNLLARLGQENSDPQKGFFSMSLDIVLDETFSRNRNLGGRLLQEIARRKMNFQYVPDCSFRHHLVDEENISLIWNAIQNHICDEEKTIWEMSFYRYLAENFISSEYLHAIRITVGNLKDRIIFFNNISNFIKKDTTLLGDLLKIIHLKNEQGSDIEIWYDVVEAYLEQPDMDLLTAKQIYIQQTKIKENFDYQKKVFLKILKKDSRFLLDYIDALYLIKKDKLDIGSDDGLQVVWKIDVIEPVMTELFDTIGQKIICTGISEHYCNSFFNNLSGEEYEKAKAFLLDYCRNNYNDCDKMNIVVDIAKNSMREVYRDVLLLFISLTQDVNLFSNIYWTEQIFCYIGDDIPGYREAEEWTNILDIIQNFFSSLKLRPIKRFINSNIEAAKKRAEQELKKRFIESEY